MTKKRVVKAEEKDSRSMNYSQESEMVSSSEDDSHIDEHLDK